MENYIYVEDKGQGIVSVFDDNDAITERRFTYSANTRSDARIRAEDHASAQAKRIGCEWGRHYK